MPLTYALISGLILCCGYLCYRWVMANERQHGYNRALLYVIYAVALIMPVFILSGNPALAQAPEVMIEIGKLTAVGQATVAEAQNSGPAIMSIISRALVTVYLIGVGVMAVVSLFGVSQLWRVIAEGEAVPMGKYILVITENKRLAPFSWMRYIVMNAQDYAENGEVIMEHERCHLRLRHWVDLIVAQIVICLQWFNPAAWLMRDELRSVHEYQADEAVLQSGADMAGYQKMLIKKAVGSRFHSFANSLNHSKLKKRVTMMYKEKSSAVRRMSALLLAPALAAGCFATAIPAVARVLDSFAEVTFANDSENKVSKIYETREIIITETFEEMPMIEESFAEPVAAMEAEMVDNDEPQSDISEPVAVAEEVVAAAEEVKAEGEKKERKVYTVADKCAEFPGGMPELLSYLQNNIKYPEEAIKNDEQGLVIVKFVIEADGSVSEVETVKSVSPSLDAEAIRVVKSLPKWIPGSVDGKPVPTWFNLPVKFKMPVEKKENRDK